MKILVAPDKFKHALDAPAVCVALARGIQAAQPEATVRHCPLADGGDGSGQVLAKAWQADERRATVLDPLGRPNQARWWLRGAEATAIIEMAEASGLALVPDGQRSASRTTSYGTGQLLRAAQQAGVRRILLCVGGSATVDGGAGCLQALGLRLHRADGTEVPEPACGADLSDIADIRPPDDPAFPALEILLDVDNPLLGERGAAPVFAPQKGATAEKVAALADGLARWAACLERVFGRDVKTVSGGGAAGGLPAGLRAALSATLVPGFDRIAEAVRLDEHLSDVDLCFTGEGRLDAQSIGGKVVAGVAARARAARVPLVVFAGRVTGGTPEDFARRLNAERVVVITPEKQELSEALRQTPVHLETAARDYLQQYF